MDVFTDFGPAHSHRATRAELDKRFGKNWVGYVELAQKLHLARRTLAALIQRGVISTGTRVGAYRVWSGAEFETIQKRIIDLRNRAETAYPTKRPDGRWECPACKKATKKPDKGLLAALVRHTITCPDLWAGLDRANEFGKVWRQSREMAFRQAGLREVEVQEGNVVRGKLEPTANFVQVLGPLAKTALRVEKSKSAAFTKTRTFTEAWTGGEGMGTQAGLENILKADKADLVYALCQLIEMGKATVVEVGALIASRTARIKALETELKRLKAEGVAGGQFWQFTLDKLVVPTPGKATTPGNPKTMAFTFGKQAEAATTKFDPKLSGKFNALVQHRCKTVQAKTYWRVLAKKIGLAAAINKLEEMLKPLGKEPCVKIKNAPPKPKPKLTISPARKAFLRQQGLYLGYLRHVKNPAQRSHIKSVAKKQGIPAAVKELLKLRKPA